MQAQTLFNIYPLNGAIIGHFGIKIIALDFVKLKSYALLEYKFF